MKIKGSLSISYRQDTIAIRIHDEVSHVEFVDAEISHEEFARALGALRHRPFTQCEVRGLANIGKKRVIEHRSIECPLDCYDRAALEGWLLENAQEAGWTVNAYLGSRGSVNRRDGKTLLKYSVTKFVEDV